MAVDKGYVIIYVVQYSLSSHVSGGVGKMLIINIIMKKINYNSY